MPATRRQPKTGTIRTLDRVRIVRPAFVVRVGYPLDFRTEADRLAAEKRADIDAFLRSQGVTLDPYGGMKPAVPKIARALAYELCRQAGWGGRERRIYTKELPEFAGREFHVQGVRFVKTGTYTPGGLSGWYGEDQDPPFLSNEQTHRLLLTGLHGVIRDEPWAGLDDLEIEAANVERIAEDK